MRLENPTERHSLWGFCVLTACGEQQVVKNGRDSDPSVFGLDEEGKLVLIDEILTPDSSRFWPADSYQVGTSPPSFDKQYVRDYLETLDWDKSPPAPRLPEEVIKNTAAKYREAQERLTN